MPARPYTDHRRASLRGRLASWILGLAAVILLVQLFAASAHHDHELAAKSQHCVACVLHAHPDAAPPDAPVLPAPSGWTLLGTLSPLSGISSPAAAAGYLLPPSRAPPPFLSIR